MGTPTPLCGTARAAGLGAEQQEPDFPFPPGGATEVPISFDRADLTLKLPDGYTFKFPNCLNLEAVNYLAAEGDFKIKSKAFE